MYESRAGVFMIEILIGGVVVALGFFICVITGYISDKFYLQDTNPILMSDYFVLGLISIIHWGLYIAMACSISFTILAII